jgi:hypothetical protein
MCGFKKVWKVNMDEMLKEHDMKWNLQGERAEALWLQAKQYIVVNTALGVHFQKEGRKLFQYGTFKGHWMLHSVKLAHYLNPRRTMCYSGESFMSVCETLMHACLKGNAVLSSVQTFLQRYIIAVSLEFERDTWKLA